MLCNSVYMIDRIIYLLDYVLNIILVCDHSIQFKTDSSMTFLLKTIFYQIIFVWWCIIFF